jgi:hypothetical protein
VELLFVLGNLLCLVLLWLIVGLAYRTLWKALVVVTPAGDHSVDLFSDEDLSREFWLVPDEGTSSSLSPTQGLRLGRGVTLGRAPECDLRLEDAQVAERHLRVLPHRDWCSIELLDPAQGYAVDSQPLTGPSLLKEGQCLSVGDVSVRLQRRPI